MRPHLAVLSCAFLCGPSLYAQDATATTPPAGVATAPQLPAARPQGRITGTVFCNDTHKPARGALVMVNPLPGDGKDGSIAAGAQAVMARVGNDGTYTAEHLVPGEYTATAVQPGYLNNMEDELDEGVAGDSSPARIREMLSRNGVVTLRGSETASFNITLQRGATLAGHILYSDGAPAAQITLILEDTAAKPPKDEKSAAQQAFGAVMMRSMLTHETMSTDDEGHFRLSGLKPGSYRLAATQPAHSSTDASDGDGMGFFMSMVPDTRALRFYAGDTPHRAAAKVFDLRAGDQVDGIDITVPVDAFHTVRGSVAAIDGRIVNMGSVTLTDTGDDTLVVHGSVDAEGTFKLLQVPSGTYTLKVTGARIGKPGMEPQPSGPPIPNGQLEPTNAFADQSTSVLVKDSDVSDVNFGLTEVPMPKLPPKPPHPDPDDN